MRNPAVYGVLVATLALAGCRSTAVPPPPAPPPPPPAPPTGCVESKGAAARVHGGQDRALRRQPLKERCQRAGTALQVWG